MKNFFCILYCGSYSLAKLMADMFLSIKNAYTNIRHYLLDGQLVLTEVKAKFQISKKTKRSGDFGLNGAALRA